MANMDGNFRVSVLAMTEALLLLRIMCCASVHASPFSGLITEPLCQVDYSNTGGSAHPPKERMVNTSLTLELNPSKVSGPCKQIFEVPPSHGLYIRLHAIGADEKNKNQRSIFGGSHKNMNFGQRTRNTTSSGSCPMNIYQTSAKPSTPWRFDPCEMNGVEEVSKLLTPPLRIVWQHSHNRPNYRLLTLTAYGEGDECDKEGKHACLRLGQQKLICISDELLCDGVHNCPVGPEFESDESDAACEEMRKKSDQWMIALKGVFMKLVQTTLPKRSHLTNGWLDPVGAGVGDLDPSGGHQQETTKSLDMAGKNLNKTLFVETVINSSNIRKNFPRGLSQYGPWGYLMLGMLLCGGALLVCGLWECCCRKQKPVSPLNGTTLETAQPVLDVNVVSNTYSAMQQQNRTEQQAVVNYDEVEPPPSYSVLFPNQKSMDDLTQIASGSYSRPSEPRE